MEHFPPRVLVLEDDDPVRELLTEVLREDGIEVAAAGDALTALDKIDAEDFDLIIADVRLPGELDGIETVRCAKARRPRLRSLFISGRVAPTLEDPEADEFVEKPFRANELLGCVWGLLLRPPPQRRQATPRQIAQRCAAAAKANCLRQRRRAACAR